MPENLIAPEIAERNRTEGLGGYTFNALPPEDYEGRVVVLACVRLGDHAHVDMETGRQVAQPNGPRIHRSRSGKLIMAWDDWVRYRDLMATVPWTRIAEVERPTTGQLEFHT